MPDPRQSLIDALVERQGSQSDPQFAQALGISHMHWWRVKHGQRGIGQRFARKILARYPELWRAVQDMLLSGEDAA